MSEPMERHISITSVGVQVFLFGGFELFGGMFGRGIQVPVIVFAGGIVGALRPSLGFGVLVEIGVAFDGRTVW